MAPRLTVADLATRLEVSEQSTTEALTGITSVLANIAARLDDGQHNTTTAVAEKVSKKAAAPVVVSPRDALKKATEAKGLAFAKGGALIGSVAVAEAVVRVLKSNKAGAHEIVSVQGDVSSLDGRKVTHVGVVLVAPGVFTTQYIYSPDKA